jgi:hypothetical protein
MEGNPPVHEVRSGLIRAAVWQNDAQDGPRYSVTFSRLYRLGDEWRSSRSFAHDELPQVAEVAARAREWIASQPDAVRDLSHVSSDYHRLDAPDQA